MPRLICVAPGCEALAVSGPHCEHHAQRAAAAAAKRKDHLRLSEDAKRARRLYASARWQAAARGFLANHPWCADCAELGAPVPATEVDHIEPHRGDLKLFWDRSNWQPLCKPCHSRKTAREVLPGPASR